MSERPTWERSRAWIAVVCLTPLPLSAALILDSSRTGILLATIISGLTLVDRKSVV